ncbi:DUF4189 domain-containing protein [Nocardia sp. NPDC057030]|uniref:DUF4189 domain-containing protein n=1 Tax=unclassified Nocardia TaxID=2637762 RepID=UPI003629D3E4
MAVGSVLAVFSATGSAHADNDIYGAIAMSASTTAVAGVTAANDSDAQDDALTLCGFADCRIIATFINRCAAVARGVDDHVAVGIGSTEVEAAQQAMVKAMSAPPFPDPGSAAPRPGRVAFTMCTDNPY